VPRIRLWLATAALGISGCGGPFPQSTLHPRSDFARATDVLFTDIFWWAAAVFVVVYESTGSQLRTQIDRDLSGDAAQLSQSLSPLTGRSSAVVSAAASTGPIQSR